MKILETWWDKGNRVFSIWFYKQHWRLLQWKNNNWRKGIDPCYDLNIYFLGISIGYTRFNCKVLMTTEEVADRLYREANPNSKMNTPNGVYMTVEKWQEEYNIQMQLGRVSTNFLEWCREKKR